MKKEMEKIKNMIHEIRGQKVILDSYLATLYQVEVKYLNRTVKRNQTRFPVDFMFQLTDKEWEDLRCQIGTAKMVKKIRYNPYVFTEQGIAMLSGLLNSEIAIKVNISIMRTFVQLRHYVLDKPDTNTQIAELRKLLMLYIEKNDKRVNDIILALDKLIVQPSKTRTIGFNANDG